MYKKGQQSLQLQGIRLRSVRHVHNDVNAQLNQSISCLSVRLLIFALLYPRYKVQHLDKQVCSKLIWTQIPFHRNHSEIEEENSTIISKTN